MRLASVGFQTLTVTDVVSSEGEQKLTRDRVHFRNLSRRGGDHFDCAHENVRHDRNAQEQPQQAHQVEEAKDSVVNENNAGNEDPTVTYLVSIIENDHFSSRKFKIFFALIIVSIVLKRASISVY